MLRQTALSNSSLLCIETMRVTPSEFVSILAENGRSCGRRGSHRGFWDPKDQRREKRGQQFESNLSHDCMQLWFAIGVYSSWVLLNYLSQQIPLIVSYRNILTVLFYPLSFSGFLVEGWNMKLQFVSKGQIENEKITSNDLFINVYEISHYAKCFHCYVWH